MQTTVLLLISDLPLCKQLPNRPSSPIVPCVSDVIHERPPFARKSSHDTLIPHTLGMGLLTFTLAPQQSLELHTRFAEYASAHLISAL